MKYLKDGLEMFADDVVRQDHTRILQQIWHTTGQICTACTLRELKPIHTYVLDRTTNRKSCPRGQSNCNCLYPNKASCPNKICDAIYEEILNSHASSPPAPCFKNTDITKWVTHPWEVAKCFINAPGYRDKDSAEEIDVAGLLHVFINNTIYQTSLSCLISGNKSDAFCKALDLRNKIFHSPNMDLEDQDLNECLRNAVSILEDEKKLKDAQCSKEAVNTIKQLQNQEFIITTETEAIVLREIVERKINNLEVRNSELTKELLEVQEKHLEFEKGHSALEDKHLKLEKGHLELQEKHVALKKGHSALEEKHLDLEEGYSELDRKHSDLSREISELKKTHLKLEKEHSDIDQRFDSVEKDVENLKNLHQKQLVSVEKRLEARRKLAKHLQKHYVKTSVSPLKTRENTIDIDKVYVEPHIETEKKDEQNKKRTVSLTSYRSIFQSDGHRMRRIYLIGEVGSGKSAFCKMVILNWCRSVKNDQTKNAEEEEEIENIETMKQFDFLFYLPLRRLQKGGRISEMIHWYYKDEIPGEILNDILLNVPEKCLILADGLDEWTPSYDEQRPQHVTCSLPYSEDIKAVTLLTTSRPSAPGVLNMTFTEFDLKIAVCGIPAISIVSMTEKYLLSISKESNKDSVLKKLKAQKIDHIEKTPLLLQQLIWMIAHNIDVGHCLSDNYTSLVNIALKWSEEKDNQKKLKTISFVHISAELRLPSQLMQYDTCWSNRNLLFILGKIAFDLLINADSQMSFGRAKLNRDGLDDDVIDMILTIGLITEDNCQNNTKQKTQFAFTYASFQEYFAALYIASHIRIKQIRRKSFVEYFWFRLNVANSTNMEQMRSPDARYQSQNEDIFELLFRRLSSVQDILQFGVVLQFLCGLAPDSLLEVSERIYQTAQQDIKYSMLRDQYLMETSDIPDLDEYVTTTVNMQKLIKSCVVECNDIGDTLLYKVSVLDLIIRGGTGDECTSLIRYINQQKVIHLSIIDVYYGCIMNNVAEFHNLQTIAVYSSRMNFFTKLHHESEPILNTNSIRKIKFIRCGVSDVICNLPVIDLFGYRKLQLINIRGVKNVQNVETKNLEVIKQAGSSKYMIEIPRQVQGSYDYDYTDILSPGNVIPKLRHLELSHIITTRDLGLFISHNVTLEVVCLRDIHVETGSLRCVIDLSAHNDLQVLDIIDTNNVDIKSVNTANLSTLITNRGDVLHAVRNASKLTSLTFGKKYTSNFSFTKQMNEDVCSCSQLQDIDLIHVTIEDDYLEMHCGMRNLKRITLNNVEMNLYTWIRFVNSLLNLNQSVIVNISLWFVDAFKFRRYIEDNEKKFKIIDDMSVNKIEFETVP